jgi:hypothetical protein
MADSRRMGLEEVLAHFQELEDPRSPINLRHPLSSVLVVALIAVLARASGPTAIARWTVLKEPLLIRVLPLPNGVPGKDVFRRVLMGLRPEAFRTSFAAWVRALRVASIRRGGKWGPLPSL